MAECRGTREALGVTRVPVTLTEVTVSRGRAGVASSNSTCEICAGFVCLLRLGRPVGPGLGPVCPLSPGFVLTVTC